MRRGLRILFLATGLAAACGGIRQAPPALDSGEHRSEFGEKARLAEKRRHLTGKKFKGIKPPSGQVIDADSLDASAVHVEGVPGGRAIVINATPTPSPVATP